MAYIHSAGWAHRDLKADNVITNGQKLTLIDFNKAVRVKNYEDCIAGSTGLKEWSAPETRSQLLYSAKCDSWSCGRLIAFMSSCCSVEPETEATEELNSLIANLMSQDPLVRLTPSEALLLPIFRHL